MPRANPELKKLCESLYLQGLKRDIIVERTGVRPTTLDKWVQRGKWLKTRDKTTQLVGREIADAQSQRVKSIVGDKLELLAKAAGTAKTPKGIRGIREHADALHAIVNPAAKTFGWQTESSAGGSLLMIGTLNQTVRDTIRPGQADRITTNEPEIPAIDVSACESTEVTEYN